MDDAPPDFPYPLVEVRGPKAYTAWKKHNALWRKEGCSGIIVGDSELIGHHFHPSMLQIDKRSTQQILADARKMKADDYFSRRLREWPTFMEDLKDGKWPGDKKPCSPTDVEKALNSSEPQIWLAKVPTAKPWEIPAYMHWGNWNDCPAPEEHVALARYWNKKYGIEIFSMRGSGSMEYIVEQPPASRDDAMKLAREHVLYCGEGCEFIQEYDGGIAKTAAGLMKRRTWYFWWD